MRKIGSYELSSSFDFLNELFTLGNFGSGRVMGGERLFAESRPGPSLNVHPSILHGKTSVRMARH